MGARRFSRALKGLAGAVVTMVVMVSVAPAQAAPLATVCTGFAGCSAAGRGDAGYAAVYRESFWGMTAGHNCTNYVAYRLTHGRLVSRPPETRNAASWGPAAVAVGVRVDDTPAVGAVAWWAADYRGASASGHVAVVEQVLPDGTVLVSEDNLNGDFRWRRMTPLTDGWPSGFIHYPWSDGSPSGEFLSVESSDPGVIGFWGTSSDPDARTGSQSYLVTLGGPRGASGVETFGFTSPYFRFHWVKPVRTRGDTTMYLYALNEEGSAGTDTLLGRRAVSIRSASSVTAAFSDSTITRTTTPVVTFTLGAVGPRGAVDIVRGTTVVARVTVTTTGRQTVMLPRQAKGTWTFAVAYRGSSTHLPSAKSVKLTVR